MARKATSKMSDEELDQAIQTSQAAWEALGVEYAALQEKLHAAYERTKKLKEERTNRTVAAASAKGEVPWETLLAYEPGEANYKALQDAMTKLSPRATIAQSGYMPDTMQYTIRLYLTNWSRDNMDEVERQLNVLLPYIKPHPETGERFVDLMEPSLSRSGIHNLWEKDGQWVLRITTYGRTRDLMTWPNTRAMLDGCQQSFNMDAERERSYDDDDSY